MVDIKSVETGETRTLVDELIAIKNNVAEEGQVKLAELTAGSVESQGWYRHYPQVFGLVCFREGFDTLIMSFGAAHHALPPPALDQTFLNFRTSRLKP